MNTISPSKTTTTPSLSLSHSQKHANKTVGAKRPKPRRKVNPDGVGSKRSSLVVLSAFHRIPCIAVDLPTPLTPQIQILRKLQKLMPTAQALVEETRDKELGEVLTALAAKVTL